MRHCPKCSKTYDDGSRICRDCGAILEDSPADQRAGDALEFVADDVSTASPADDDAFDMRDGASARVFEGDVPPVSRVAHDHHESVNENAAPWRCSNCLQDVPGNFDLCWNCGVEQGGTVPVDIVDESPGEAPDVAVPPISPDTVIIDAVANDAVANDAAVPAPLGFCAQCQTHCVMQGLALTGVGDAVGSEVKVVVYGNPDAVIFKSPYFGNVVADVCGQCGHVQFRVTNAKDLLDHFLGSVDED